MYWVMQDLYHQQYHSDLSGLKFLPEQHGQGAEYWEECIKPTSPHSNRFLAQENDLICIFKGHVIPKRPSTRYLKFLIPKRAQSHERYVHHKYGTLGPSGIWEFPKIRGRNIDPEKVGILL